MQTNVPLKDYTTMKLGGPARFLTTAQTPEDIASLAKKARSRGLLFLVIGAGSNIIVGDQGFAGLVVLNRIPGFKVINESSLFTVIKVGAGEVWDEVVKNSVDLNLSGIENLSAIPGYAGAAPFQNIGAYGQEIADTLIELEAYDLKEEKFVTLTNSECDFRYRHSIFNTTARHHYVITSISLQLAKKPLESPFYDSLQAYLDEQAVTDYSPHNLRQAVKAIRATKLPDPSVMANTGSFFKNPLIEKWQADELQKKYSDVQLFPMGDNMFKVPAGWLIEQAGLKGLEMDGMKVYDFNALVLVNEHAASHKQLAQIRDYIIEAVRNKFQITLIQEPEEIGI